MPEALGLGRPFPNPATASITIPASVPVATQAVVELVNLAGRVILVEERMLPKNTVGIQWSLPSTLPGGTYVLRIRAGKLIRQFPLLIKR